jgi:hypothetical protein
MTAEPITRDLAAFLHQELAPADFHHADHIRLGFEILQRHDFPDATVAFVTGLKGVASRAGSPGAYHETITIAFLALIAERCGDLGEGGYPAFAAANPDLFDKSALLRWYTPERLHSKLARKTFILPDPVLDHAGADH